jgi:hypothetical protein
MKICVLGFHCDSVEVLVADESLGSLRRVMDAGLYGMLKNVSGWLPFTTSQTEDAGAQTTADCISEAGKRAIIAGQSAKLESLSSGEQSWDYLQMLDPDYASLSSLDAQLGMIVESMDSDTILLVIAIGEANHDGLFALAAPNCPLAGEFEGANAIDLAPTLLDLAGYKIPDNMKGKSLVAGMEKKNPAESSGDDQLVQDRLSGLGYV